MTDFLIIVGSTRKGRRSIHAAEEVDTVLQEQGHQTTLFDLKEKEIPFLGNRSYTDEEPVPEDIQELSQLVQDSDGIMIISPEYNHSIPGVLKNALDYLYPEYSDKPFSYVTTSAGGFGGVRALGHLQDITLALGGFPGPSVQISDIGSVFEDGELVDKETRERVEQFADKADQHVRKLN